MPNRDRAAAGFLLRRIAVVVAALAIFTLGAAQPAVAQSVELACPAGTTPLPYIGTTRNATTGNLRQWACFAANGQITIQPDVLIGGGSPGGASGDVQYNNGAGGFGAEAALNYNEASNTLTVGTILGTQGGSSFTLTNSGTFSLVNSGLSIAMSGLGDLISNQGTRVTSLPFVRHSVTHNAGGVTFENFVSNTTDTASAEGSTYFAWQVNSVSRVALVKGGGATEVGIGPVLTLFPPTGGSRYFFGDWSTGTQSVVHKFVGDGTSNFGVIFQSDPNTTGTQGMRFGLFETDTYGTVGGSAMGTNNTVITWVNNSGNNDAKVCIGRFGAAINTDCRDATDADVIFMDKEAGASFTMDIIGGASQGTASIVEIRASQGGQLLWGISGTGRMDFGGNSVVAGDFTISAGWGNTATVSAAGGRDQAPTFTITSGGTGQGANPTITLTFGDGAFLGLPSCIIQQIGGTGALAFVTESSRSTTTTVWIWNGTPVDTLTYQFRAICPGIN